MSKDVKLALPSFLWHPCASACQQLLLAAAAAGYWTYGAHLARCESVGSRPRRPHAKEGILISTVYLHTVGVCGSRWECRLNERLWYYAFLSGDTPGPPNTCRAFLQLYMLLTVVLAASAASLLLPAASHIRQSLFDAESFACS